MVYNSITNVRLKLDEVSCISGSCTVETPTNIVLDLFDYVLPEDRIAQYPVPERDQSKLLMANARTKTISHHRFINLPELLPPGSLLIRNTSQVISARLLMRKVPTGGHCELLLVSPIGNNDFNTALESSSSTWTCLLGGHRIRAGQLLETLNENGSGIHAEVLNIDGMYATVLLHTIPPTTSIGEQIAQHGYIPLPPYIERSPTADDYERYQTIYARESGSVAAPTAGLHFTDRVIDKLKQNGVEFVDTVLHIGPGTFQPIRTREVDKHTMHAECIVVGLKNMVHLYEYLTRPNRGLLVCVGTTSVRTIESLYWLAVRLHVEGIDPTLPLGQNEPSTLASHAREIPSLLAVEKLIEWCEQNAQPTLSTATQLYILPDYRYRFCEALITNFHQPRSTLLLLVAALIGPWWRTIYDEALAHGYRFLSYGDASLLIADQPEQST